MTNMTAKLVVAAALVATAGCAKNRPDVLPPAPNQTAPTPTPTYGGAPADTIRPGSEADFKRSVVDDTVHFGFDAYDIDPQARTILDSQAQWLIAHPDVRVTIEGNTDERGTREYNLALGDRRATATANYLIAKGVNSSRINTISYGKERPIAMGSNEEAWAQNRRAVTVVIE